MKINFFFSLRKKNFFNLGSEKRGEKWKFLSLLPFLFVKKKFYFFYLKIIIFWVGFLSLRENFCGGNEKKWENFPITMGCTENEKIRYSFFFNYSFFGEKWRAKNGGRKTKNRFSAFLAKFPYIWATLKVFSIDFCWYFAIFLFGIF